MARAGGRLVGIDLGTTFSALACIDARGRPVAVPNAEGEPVTPSVVLIRPDRTIRVGSTAARAEETEPGNVAYNFKRDMGESFYHRPVGGRSFSPEALSALVLKKLVAEARPTLGLIGGSVITVPAYFGDRRRQATADAGRIASIEVVDIINEPTAAALANAFRCYVESGGSTTRFEMAGVAASAPSTTLVFDLGGGTFDVTVIRINGPEFEVVATGGEVRLGGVDFDERVVDYYCEHFVRKHGVDPRDREESHARVRHAAEQAKITLSSRTRAKMAVEHMGRTLETTVTRDRFEALTADLISRTQLSTEMLLQDALLSWDRIDDILLVGGSVQMPAVWRMLENISGKQPNMAVAPNQIVAHGAAIHAAILQMRERAAVSVLGGGRRIDGDALTDVDKSSAGSVNSVDFDPSVVEAARAVCMTDVNSHSLGVLVHSSREKRVVNSMMIPRNTPLPCTRSKVFGTEQPDQRTVRVPVVEGETRDPQGCRIIGECVIANLPAGLAKGSPVEVTFQYDRSGRVHVRAIESLYQISSSVDIKRRSGLGPEQLDTLSSALRELDIE